MTSKTPKMRKIAQPGHYKVPTVKLPGMSTSNTPVRGRLAKQMPSPKKFGKK